MCVFLRSSSYSSYSKTMHKLCLFQWKCLSVPGLLVVVSAKCACEDKPLDDCSSIVSIKSKLFTPCTLVKF